MINDIIQGLDDLVRRSANALANAARWLQRKITRRGR